jgi:hypothetical protein
MEANFQRVWTAGRLTKKQALALLVVLFGALCGLMAVGVWTLRNPGSLRLALAKWSGAEVLEATDVVFQRGQNGCGPACLRMVARSLGVKLVDQEDWRDIQRSLGDLMRSAARAGLEAKAWRLRKQDLDIAAKPLIAFVSGNHFVVVDESNEWRVVVRDPALGKLSYERGKFNRIWSGEVLIVKAPGNQFSARADDGFSQ